MITEEDYLTCEKIIYKQMKPYVKYHDQDDLYQAGQLGVVKASDIYDPSYNVKFSTHAFPWIQGEITDFVHKDSIMRVSSDMVKKYRHIMLTQESLIQSGLERPTYSDIGVLLNMEEDEVEMVVELVQRSFVQSADQICEQNGVDCYNQNGQVDYLLQPEIQDLYTALDQLEPESRKIIDYHYFQGYSQQETAEQLGMSQATLSRTEQKIMQKLKTYTAA